MSMGINSLLSNLDDKMQVFRANPEQAMQRAKITGKTLDAIAAEKVLNEKLDAANELQRQLVPNENTITGQTDQALQGMAVQELAEGIGKVFQVNQARKQKNLNKVASMGLAGAPVQRKMAMADGGIVGYFDGKAIDMENEREEEERKKRFLAPGLGGIMQPNLKKLKEDAFTDIAERSGITPMESTITTDESGFVKGTDNFNIPTTQLGKYEPPVAKDRSEMGADPSMMPNMPNQNIIPPAEEDLQEKLENPPEDLNPTDTPKERTRKKNTYNEWFERLLTVLSAPATGRGLGGGNVARAYVQFSQRVIDNFNDVLTLEIEEEKVKAAKKFNALKAQGMNDAKLMALKEDYVNQIRQIRDKANTSTVALRLEGDKNKLIELQTKDSPDTDTINALKAKIRAAERIIEAGIKQQTKMQIAEIETIDQILRGSIKGLPSLTTGGSGVPQGFQNKANVVQGP